MSARKIIPKPGRVCLAKDGTRIPPEGIDVDLSTPDLAVWATRLVDVHGDATFDEPPPVSEAPAVDAPAVELAAEPEVKPERARSRKGDA